MGTDDTMTTAEQAAYPRIGPERDFYLVPIEDAPPSMLLARGLLLDVLGPLDVNAWIAGGAVRDVLLGRAPKDVDVYFERSEDHAAALASLLRRGGKVAHTYECVTRVDADGAIDLVSRLFEGPLATVRSFDFTAICGAVSRTHFACHRLFGQHARAMALEINALPNPGSSVERALRFLGRGWSMRGEDAMRLADLGQCASEDWSSPGREDEDADVETKAMQRAAELRAQFDHAT